MDLAETLRKPEGKTLEFKRDLSSPDRFLHTVVAFTNTSGPMPAGSPRVTPMRVAGMAERP